MVEIRELRTEEEWREAFACLQSLRPKLELEAFLDRREILRSRDYFLYGLYTSSGLVCVAGYVLQPHVERGVEFWLHDFATLPTKRSQGHGERMMQHLEGLAAEQGCQRLMLHTLLRRERAQSFYRDKAKYEEYGIVYAKQVAAR